ncbi:MAG: hypothetical protein F6K47_08625 [Symploca sp. SIO2E6]|nr:hypothetical protein [Symploca sp. SIO2E6]
MGIGNWELGIGNWELGIENASLVSLVYLVLLVLSHIVPYASLCPVRLEGCSSSLPKDP